jgi:hypothetical protein
MRPAALLTTVRAAIHGCDREITSFWLVQAARITRRQARNAIRLLLDAGELQRVERGTYRATTHAGVA